MRFEDIPLAGAFLITPDPVEDERGAFARLFDAAAFAERGLVCAFDQISTSFNRRAGTLRGLHLQRPPHAEIKLVRVTSGAVFDVIVDLRAGSPTYAHWYGAELSAENRRQLYIPAGFAHGFQSLRDASEVAYCIAAPYRPELQDGVRFDDPDLAIAWPAPDRAIISARDRGLPAMADFRPIEVPC